MADQKRIKLYTLHATPKNVIMRELPVANASATTKIYLYTTHATPKNVVMRDPTAAPIPAGDTVNGTLSATLGALTLSSAGQVIIDGDLAATLGSLTLSGAGQLVIDADLGVTLAPLTAGGVGNVEIDADQGTTLEALTLSATGTVEIAAALGVTLDDLTLVSEGALSGGEQAPTYYGGGRKRRDERDEYQSYSEYFDELNKLRRSIKERKAPSQQRKLVAKVANARQRLVEQDEIDLGPLRASVASLAKSVTVLERARAEAAAMAELDRLAAQAALFEEIAVVLLMAA